MEQILIPIKGRPNLARDLRCGNIVNIDKNGIMQAKKQREYLTSMQQNLKNAESEIASLKQQVNEMQNFVKGIAEKYAISSSN